MTRTTHSDYPRAVQKDRHESRNGLQNATKKQGAGPHAWGSYEEEINHYELGVKDTLDGMRKPAEADQVADEQRRDSNVSIEERDNARKERMSFSSAGKTNDMATLTAIARSSAAGSANTEQA